MGGSIIMRTKTKKTKAPFNLYLDQDISEWLDSLSWEKAGIIRKILRHFYDNFRFDDDGNIEKK